KLRGIELSEKTSPPISQILDELPILAVAATQAEGKTIFRDAGELRVKESDRITAISVGLSDFGAKVEAKEDGMVIEGGFVLRGEEANSFGDHRIAMALRVAGVMAGGGTRILGFEAADISYPLFSRDLEKVLE
ncbi:3-phosphoshikimate 1-carboxyvinyltransferase, partial [Bdellovibrionota bacterium]